MDGTVESKKESIELQHYANQGKDRSYYGEREINLPQKKRRDTGPLKENKKQTTKMVVSNEHSFLSFTRWGILGRKGRHSGRSL